MEATRGIRSAIRSSFVCGIPRARSRRAEFLNLFSDFAGENLHAP